MPHVTHIHLHVHWSTKYFIGSNFWWELFLCFHPLDTNKFFMTWLSQIYSSLVRLEIELRTFCTHTVIKLLMTYSLIYCAVSVKGFNIQDHNSISENLLAVWENTYPSLSNSPVWWYSDQTFGHLQKGITKSVNVKLVVYIWYNRFS